VNCKHVEKYLTDYISGNIDPVIKDLIDRHLAECAECRRRYDDEKSVTDFLKQAETARASAGIKEDVLNRLKDIDQETRDTPLELSTQKSSSRLKWLALGVTLLGLAGIGLLIIPFESQLNEQHIGSSSGPGYTWIGDYPVDVSDPFSLDALGVPTAKETPKESGESEERVIHTLDFDAMGHRTEESDGKEKTP